MAAGGVGIKGGVVVDGGVIVFEGELADGGAAEGEVEFSGGEEGCVADGFGVETGAVHAPEEAVVAILEGGGGAVGGALAVGGAGYEEAVELLKRAVSFVAEPDGEPIEELRVGGWAAHFAEVGGGIDEAGAEVILPYAVDDGAPGEDVLGIGEPVGEGGAAVAFVIVPRVGGGEFGG